jgi:hypothetical protein
MAMTYTRAINLARNTSMTLYPAILEPLSIAPRGLHQLYFYRGLPWRSTTLESDGTMR